MCAFIKNIFGLPYPSASVETGKFVISLPDAMTPVVWMMDISSISDFLFKVDETSDGLYVLQKIVANGNKAEIEDIAYYSKRVNAIRALNAAHKGMSQGKDCCAKGSGIGSFLGTFIKWFVLVCLALSFITVMVTFVMSAMSGNSEEIILQEQEAAIKSPPASGNLGVPQSADDFLMRQKTE